MLTTLPCRSGGSGRSCATPTSSSPISNAVCTGRPRGMPSSMKDFSPIPEIAGEALQIAGINAVGIANNVNYGAAAILGSIAELDRLGIAHTGAGANLAAARAPAIVAAGGSRVGFVQRSSVYWPTDHEASATVAGIAVLRGHTAYQVPAAHDPARIPPMNRPGVPPIVVTWADRAYVAEFRQRIAALRPTGRHRRRVLSLGARRGDARIHDRDRARGDRRRRRYRYRARAALFAAGRDLSRQAIFYGLGSFSFHTGHGGRKHGDWIGMMARIEAGPAASRRRASASCGTTRPTRPWPARWPGGRRVRPNRRTQRPPRHEADPRGRLDPDCAVTTEPHYADRRNAANLISMIPGDGREFISGWPKAARWDPITACAGTPIGAELGDTPYITRLS